MNYKYEDYNFKPFDLKEFIDKKADPEVISMSATYTGPAKYNRWPNDFPKGIHREGELNRAVQSHEYCAIYDITQQQFERAKKHFYFYAIACEMWVKELNHPFFAGTTYAGPALLSDNDELIKRFANLRYDVKQPGYKAMEEDIATGSYALWAHTVFMFIQDNEEMISRDLDLIEQTTEMANSRFRWDFAFLKALQAKDIQAMETTLYELISPAAHLERNLYPFQRNFISMPALTLAKLAWYKGFEVNVDSFLIPKELLPIRPLSFYE